MEKHVSFLKKYGRSFYIIYMSVGISCTLLQTSLWLYNHTNAQKQDII